MKSYFFRVLFIVSLIFAQAIVHAREIQWQYWSEQTIEQAAQQDRLIFISLTAKWCQYCKKMEQTTYKDQSVIEQLQQHFIAIKADEEEFPQLASRFSNVGRPGTIILDEKGNQLLAKSGYLKPQWMLWMLQGTHEEYKRKENNHE